MSAARPIEALRSEAHIWLTGPAEPGATARYLPLLAPEEIEQYERFRVEKARRLYLAGRALARSVLSRYHPEVEPGAWCFRFNRHGRPEIEGPDEWPPLRFNLSHTDGLVACAVTLGRDAGVDVEEIGRDLDLVGIAEHSFSRLETEDVRSLRGPEQRERFFRYWTLKEAYIKARGMGLALPLRRFSYTFPVHDQIAVRFEPEVEDREIEWQFALWQASRNHYLAAALRRGETSDLDWVVRKATPLAEDAELVQLELLALSKASEHV